MKNKTFLLQIHPHILFICFISPFLLFLAKLDFYATFIAPVTYFLWLCWMATIVYCGQDMIGDKTIKGLKRKHVVFNSFFLLIGVALSLITNKYNPESFWLQTLIAIITLYTIYSFFYTLIMAGLIVTIIEYDCNPGFINSTRNILRILVFPFGALHVQSVLRKKLQTADQ